MTDLTALSLARSTIVQAANSVIGWTAPDMRLGGLVAPGDTPAKQLAIEHESLCMLVTLGIQDMVFDVPPRGPYVNGSAPALLEQRAKGSPFKPAGAVFLVNSPGSYPDIGDAIWWGKSPFAPEHVETVVDVHAADSAHIMLTCVAGGQRTSAHTFDPNGAETIAQVSRVCVWDGHAWTDTGSKRPIIALIDADAMAGLYSLRA